MCRFFSGIITKQGVIFDMDNDSHEVLLKKGNLKDTSRSPDFVRVELLPQDNDVFNMDLSNWKLKVDQDYKPDWFKPEWAEKEMKETIQKVWAERFIVDDKSWQKREGQRLWVKNSSVKAWENSSVVARENSSVEARENSSVKAWGNSSVEAWENSSVEARENSSVEARENSSVKAWENSSVVARENSSVEARENSSVEARGNSSVEARENSSVVARENSSVVARENSSVEARENSSVLIPHSDGIKIKRVSDNASVKDLSGKIPKIYVANPKIKLVRFKLPKTNKKE